METKYGASVGETGSHSSVKVTNEEDVSHALSAFFGAAVTEEDVNK